MKFSIFSSVALLAVSAAASPVSNMNKRAGPSGRLLTPYDGFSVDENAGIAVKYTRVAGDSGYFTEL